MWSLGIVLYVCLSGKLPFTGESTDQIFQTVLQKDLLIYDDPDFQHISDEGKHLLDQMLRKNPRKRISPAEALKHPWMQLFEEGGRLHQDEIQFQNEGITGLIKKKLSQ
jgi:calcium-dependent protein kinase